MFSKSTVAAHSRHLIDFPGVVPQMRIVRQATQVALEQQAIDRVEADQCREEPQIGFGKPAANRPALATKPGFQFVNAAKRLAKPARRPPGSSPGRQRYTPLLMLS